jgi:hypothetical protein
VPAVSPSSQLQVSLASIATTIAGGDDYARLGDLPHALNAYRTAGSQFAALPVVGNSLALVAQVAAVTSATAAGLAQAKALLMQLTALYHGQAADAATMQSRIGFAIGAVGLVGLVALLVVQSRRRRRQRNRP